MNRELKAELQRKQSVKLLKLLKQRLMDGVTKDVAETFISLRENRITEKQFNTYLFYSDIGVGVKDDLITDIDLVELIAVTEDYNLYKLLP